MGQYKTLFLSVLLCLSCSAAFTEQPIKLQYLPGKPVSQVSVLKVRSQSFLPALKLNSQATQIIESVIGIAGSISDLPVIHPPFDLFFELKDMRVELKSNGVEASYHALDPENSLDLAEVNRLINRQIKIHFGKDFKIEGENPDLKKIMNELSILKELGLENFVMEWFQHLFALGGEDLAVGAVYKKKDTGLGFAQTLSYEVTAVDENEIHAKINGEMVPRIFTLKGDVEWNGSEQGGGAIEMTVSGPSKGTIAWNRQNALIHKLTLQQEITATIKMPATSWSIVFTLNHQIESK